MTISHAWEDDTLYDVANLTGIPAHIVNYVNHEKMSIKMDRKFEEQNNKIVKELDRREMGAGMTFELIEDRISKPMLAEFKALKAAMIENKEASDGVTDSKMPSFTWTIDGPSNIPRLLPENYVLPTKIHPTAIWNQWHHGASFENSISVGPLKHIEPKHCPEKFRRRFCLMRKFCKALDGASGVIGGESIAELGVAFADNSKTFRELGILLPENTPTNRRRSRDENGWCYIAQNWEKKLKLQKRACDSGMSIEELLKLDEQKEKLRQKRFREKKANAKKIAACAGDDDGVRQQQPAQRRRSNTGLAISASVVQRVNNLLN